MSTSSGYEDNFEDDGATFKTFRYGENRSANFTGNMFWYSNHFVRCGGYFLAEFIVGPLRPGHSPKFYSEDTLVLHHMGIQVIPTAF